jgi:predicted short-subunit dehydrogenase-like oxidoreductase (DUF2520 family)
VGPGRLGHALVRALREAESTRYPLREEHRTRYPLGEAESTRYPLREEHRTRCETLGPLARGADAADADAVLLCVPDQEIAAAASRIAPGRLVGHCSGATGLEVLGSHEAFSLHPLMTVIGRSTSFTGGGAAVAGSTPQALAFAEQLARSLGMRAVRVDPEDRALYHAAASMASNFLVTLEAAAERLAASTGVDRALLVPLVRASMENWAAVGGPEALSGPVVRGDEETVRRQRDAVAERAPDLLELFDALVQATRALAGREVEPAHEVKSGREPETGREVKPVREVEPV